MTLADIKTRLRLAAQWIAADLERKDTWLGIGSLLGAFIPKLAGQAENIAIIGIALVGMIAVLYTGNPPPPDPGAAA